jgi:BTB/POZ domain-containing protein KCTD9
VKREEALKNFNETYVKVKSYENICKMDKYCKAEKINLAEQYSKEFLKVCKQISNLQEKEEKGKILNMHFQVLRTDILSREYTIQISGYEKTSYLDKNPVQTKFEAKEFFKQLDELYEYLVKNAKKYVGKVSVDDVEIIIQKEITNYIRYVISIARIAIESIQEKEEFKKLEKEEKFTVYVGEYKDESEKIYIEENKKEEKEIINLL